MKWYTALAGWIRPVSTRTFASAAAVLALSAVPAGGEDLEQVAACAGTVIGQSVVDLYYEDATAFEEGARLALLAYYGSINARDYSEEEIEAADLLLGEQTDRILSAANEDRYDGVMFGEVLDCYRQLALGLYENRAVLDADAQAYEEAVDISIEALRETFAREE